MDLVDQAIFFAQLACSTGLGSTPNPKTDVHRFVKWPKYVRLQRQKRVLSMRLKVPPAINQFMTKVREMRMQLLHISKLLLFFPGAGQEPGRDPVQATAQVQARGQEAEARQVRGVSMGRCRWAPKPMDFLVHAQAQG